MPNSRRLSPRHSPARLFLICILALPGLVWAVGPVQGATPLHGPYAESPYAESAPADTAESAVRATIEELFDGMRAGDAAVVRKVFHPEARLFTATADTLRGTDIERFAEAVGAPHDEVWDERTHDVTVDVDGPMASAWVPYTFYRGDTFSHCGVNAVQLFWHENRWQILQLVDTRREDCAGEGNE
jgi:hypothetical protein